MTTRQAKMLSLIESSKGYEDVLRTLTAAIESQWADETNPPAKLGALLEALHAATDVAAELDAEAS